MVEDGSDDHADHRPAAAAGARPPTTTPPTADDHAHHATDDHHDGDRPGDDLDDEPRRPQPAATARGDALGRDQRAEPGRAVDRVGQPAADQPVGQDAGGRPR